MDLFNVNLEGWSSWEGYSINVDRSELDGSVFSKSYSRMYQLQPERGL